MPSPLREVIAAPFVIDGGPGDFVMVVVSTGLAPLPIRLQTIHGDAHDAVIPGPPAEVVLIDAAL